MKILVCGDSWSSDYTDDEIYAWPKYLINHEITNVSFRGAANNQVCDKFLKHYKKDQYDLVIIGWSGCTRYESKSRKKYEFNSMDLEVEKYYKDYKLDDFIIRWENYIDKVIANSNVPVLHFSVFGDMPYKKYDNFLDKSYLEWLANEQGTYFKYDIPIFEYDWLFERNYPFVKRFAENNFPKHWKKACIEREEIRPSELFRPCGHPNTAGHKKFGNYILRLINDKFS